MLETVIDWDGTEVPSALRGLPPGRYVVTPLDDDDELTEEEEAGILLGLDQADRGELIPLDQAIREIRDRARRR